MNDEAETMTSSKPYLIRAIYDWILDNQMTPHLVVDANYPDTRVPIEFVEDGRLVLNIAPGAVRNLLIGNDWIEFNARFSGVAREIMVPCEAVVGIFTRENGQGMVFPEPLYPETRSETKSAGLKPVKPALEDATAGSATGPAGIAATGKPGAKGKSGPTLKVVK